MSQIVLTSAPFLIAGDVSWRAQAQALPRPAGQFNLRIGTRNQAARDAQFDQVLLNLTLNRQELSHLIADLQRALDQAGPEHTDGSS